MIPSTTLSKARTVLSRCRTLTEVEKHLGGSWDETFGRDRPTAAIAWGLFDGYRNRPQPGDCALGPENLNLYREAYGCGQQLALEAKGQPAS